VICSHLKLHMFVLWAKITPLTYFYIPINVCGHCFRLSLIRVLFPSQLIWPSKLISSKPRTYPSGARLLGYSAGVVLYYTRLKTLPEPGTVVYLLEPRYSCPRKMFHNIGSSSEARQWVKDEWLNHQNFQKLNNSFNVV